MVPYNGITDQLVTGAFWLNDIFPKDEPLLLVYEFCGLLFLGEVTIYLFTPPYDMIVCVSRNVLIYQLNKYTTLYL